MTDVSMREMLEAGVHFGHQTRYWNPKMAPYIFGQRNSIHIINLEQTVPLYTAALDFVKGIAADNGTVLFVGTKRSARESIRTAADRSGMPHVSHRWLGGMLTNFKTIKQSIRRLEQLEGMAEDGGFENLTKKEGLGLKREQQKLERSLGGIKDMKSLPDVIFVIDVNHEKIAIAEARKLGIPVVAIVDTNCSPKEIDFVIPGNDDAMRATKLYCEGIADAVLEGKSTLPTVPDSDDEFIEVDDPASKKAKSRKRPAKKAAVVTESTQATPPAEKAAGVAEIDAQAAASEPLVTDVETAKAPPAAEVPAAEVPAAEAAAVDAPAAEAAAVDAPAAEAPAVDAPAADAPAADKDAAEDSAKDAK
jgi:small subunit ribosomal protein S2